MAVKTTGCCILAFIAMTSGRPAAQAPALSILHANVVRVTDGLILADQTINIEGSTIRSVMPDGPRLTGAQIVDATGLFVVPGLWDMHGHLGYTGTSSLQLYVANGVTGVRDMASALDTVLELRESTRSGRALGPRILMAGPHLMNTSELSRPEAHALHVDTAASGRAAVQMLKRRGVDFVKVHSRVPREAYFAIADEARRQDLPLVGHLPDEIALDEAIDAGQIGFEHIHDIKLWETCSEGTTYRAESCRAYFEGLARRGIWQTPTLLTYREVVTMTSPLSTVDTEQLAYATRSLKDFWAWLNQKARPDPQIVGLMRSQADVAAVVAKDLAASGVGILAGCDLMVPGFCVHDELALLVRGGMSTLGALQTATINPARFLGLTRALGTVAADKEADLVLLEGNPLDDIGQLERIRAVVVRGQLLDRPTLDGLLAAVLAAAPTQ